MAAAGAIVGRLRFLEAGPPDNVSKDNNSKKLTLNSPVACYILLLKMEN